MEGDFVYVQLHWKDFMVELSKRVERSRENVGRELNEFWEVLTVYVTVCNHQGQ